MPPEFHIKDPGYEYRLISRRIYFAGALMFLLGMLIVIRVFFLQVVMHDHFTTLSQHNRVKIQPIAPIRGLIFSSDGVLIANNRPSFSLALVPEQVVITTLVLKSLLASIAFIHLQKNWHM
jgi:penicillin-binding protein 2